MKSFAICICPFSCPEVHGFSFLSCWQACVWPAVLGRGLLGPRAFPLLFLQVFQSPEGVCETVQHPARVRGCGPLGVLVLECVWLESEQDEGSLDFGVLAEVLAWAKKIYIQGFYQAWGKIQASSQHCHCGHTHCSWASGLLRSCQGGEALPFLPKWYKGI